MIFDSVLSISQVVGRVSQQFNGQSLTSAPLPQQMDKRATKNYWLKATVCRV
jgi:hypothetical protein